LRKALLAYVPEPPPPRVEPVEPQVDPADPGSVVTSVTDIEEIRRFDREHAAPKDSSTDSKTFPTGFSWRKRYDAAISKDVWDLYNPAGDHCGVRRTQERADQWCENEGSIT
jgi:hypothetical protein